MTKDELFDKLEAVKILDSSGIELVSLGVVKELIHQLELASDPVQHIDTLTSKLDELKQTLKTLQGI